MGAERPSGGAGPLARGESALASSTWVLRTSCSPERYSRAPTVARDCIAGVAKSRNVSLRVFMGYARATKRASAGTPRACSHSVVSKRGDTADRGPLSWSDSSSVVGKVSVYSWRSASTTISSASSTTGQTGRARAGRSPAVAGCWRVRCSVSISIRWTNSSSTRKPFRFSSRPQKSASNLPGGHCSRNWSAMICTTCLHSGRWSFPAPSVPAAANMPRHSRPSAAGVPASRIWRLFFRAYLTADSSTLRRTAEDGRW
mmetsp:Transcript_4532/g.8072  ORF Transcript_4532/g.8072 Transcript_4532/m.8072 type:complete len:258 (+) Transcript_4532:1782-2555(+)